MDGPTLIFMLSLLLALTAIAQLLLHLLHSDIAGLREWAIGCALIAVGVLVNGQRGSFAAIMAGNLLISFGHATMLAGARRFRGVPARTGPLLLLALLATLPLFLLPEIAAQSRLRVILHAGLLATFAAAIGYTFLRIPGLASRINAGVFAVYAAIQAARSGWAISHATGIDVVAHGDFTPVFTASGIVVVFALANASTLMVSERLRNELARKANHDPLTGLLNRRGLDLVTDRMFAATRRAPQPVAALMMDLDHFKKINDGFGHAAGDRVLEAFAKLVSAQLRAGDIFARMGGEEFIALLPDCDAATATAVAERIRDGFAKATSRPQVTVSIGVATDAASRIAISDLIRHADAALYQAKMDGRNRVAVAQNAEGPDRDAIEAF